ncbi:hypothetical protein ABEQ05_12175, partial [Cutibacterium acnes]
MTAPPRLRWTMGTRPMPSSGIVFTPNRAGIAEVTAGAAGPVFKLVRKAQAETQLVANRITPTDTGRLRGANETTPIVVQGTKVVAGVENKTSYAMFVHEGTRAHVIEPRNKRVLAWVPRGGTVRFAKRVHH